MSARAGISIGLVLLLVLSASLLRPTSARSEVVFEQRWGEIGGGQGQFLGAPTGLSVAPSGNVLVADPVGSRVMVFGPSGGFIREWGSFGVGAGQFLGGPRAIDVAPSGDVFVTDPGTHRVQAFEPDGDFIRAWGSQGSGDGQFAGTIAGIAADSAGNVVVTEGGLSEGGHRVHVFDEQGNLLRRWGGFGSGDGEFWSPVGVALNGVTGEVFVADSANWRVQTFGLGGAFIRKWGSCCSGDGQFGSPEALDLDPLGRVLVGDPSRARIQQFTRSGAFRRKWGSCCGAPAWEVTDLAAGPEGKIYALDSAPAAAGAHPRIQRFAIVPATGIDSGPGGFTRDDKPSFTFSADEPASSFECRLGLEPWSGCTSPWVAPRLADGGYRFRVRATDSLGTTDPTPAKSDFTVDTVLDGSARAKGRQRQRARSIAVTVRVRAREALTARVRGTVRVNPTYRLKQVRRGVAAGKSRKLRLKPLRTRDARGIARALRQGKRPLAKLTVRLKDEAGNEADRKLRVRLWS